MRPTENMCFGLALDRLRNGGRVQRSGWNGKGMFLWVKNGSYAADTELTDGLKGLPAILFDKGDKGTVNRLPCICMKTATGETLEGWLASQTDMLAMDWRVVEGEAA